MTDRELLELAAKAAAYGPFEYCETSGDVPGLYLYGESRVWQPLDDDGDALRLVVKLNLDIRYACYDTGIAVIVGGSWDEAPESIHEIFEGNGDSATRRAITRAAAKIGAALSTRAEGGKDS